MHAYRFYCDPLAVPVFNRRLQHAAAKRAGFQKDDLIISYDGITDSWRETELFAYVLNQKKTGDQVPVTVIRGDRQIELKLPVQD